MDRDNSVASQIEGAEGKPVQAMTYVSACMRHASQIEGAEGRSISAVAPCNSPLDRRTGLNPKDTVGQCKPNIALIPAVALIHEALAMSDGGDKYTPFNWREKGKPVQAMTYVSACMRHLQAWVDGEEYAEDSEAHHLAHARSCLGILLDAMSCEQMVDNRPPKGAASRVTKELTDRRQKIVAKKLAEGKPVQ